MNFLLLPFRVLRCSITIILKTHFFLGKVTSTDATKSRCWEAVVLIDKLKKWVLVVGRKNCRFIIYLGCFSHHRKLLCCAPHWTSCIVYCVMPISRRILRTNHKVPCYNFPKSFLCTFGNQHVLSIMLIYLLSAKRIRYHCTLPCYELFCCNECSKRFLLK